MPPALNVLWISLEDTSPRFGCYGDPLARTPHIDRLAREGRRYPLAFSTCAVCAPSRCAVITGMYATSIGGHHMRTTHSSAHSPELPTPYNVVPPPYVKTFTEYLRAAGYYCTNNAKTDYQFAPPCTAWDECGPTAHWRHRGPGQPFFAVFNPTVTHESGMWPRADRQVLTDPDKVELPPYLPDTPKARLALARHYDNLEVADRRVGELLDQLDSDGLADNTAVFLWSDHGEGLPRAKRWPYDAGIRIPLIVRWPDHLPPGSTAEDLVSLIDLAPTLLSMVGIQLPRHFQGQAFLGDAASSRQYVFASRDRHDEAYDMVRAVRDQRFKYIRHFFPGTPYLPWIPYRNRHPVMQELWRLYAEGRLTGPQTVLFEPRPPEELYDTSVDPYELHNLAQDPAHAATLERLRQACDAWRRTCGDLGEEPEAQMAARMWPGGIQPETVVPLFVPLGPEGAGVEPSGKGGAFPDPLLLQMHCATQGASINYTFEAGEAAKWRLYTAPLRLPHGATTVRAKAGRIGFKDSAEQTATFLVERTQATATR